MAMDARLNELVHNTDSLVVLPDRRRIKCLYTMHEMPFNFEVVSQCLSCTKYRRACVDQLLEEHKDYIVDVSKSSKHPNQLFCELTWRYINKDVDHLLCHLKGRNFRNALMRYNQCKAAGEDFIATSSKYKHPSFFNETSAHADADPGHKRNCTESDGLQDERACHPVHFHLFSLLACEENKTKWTSLVPFVQSIMYIVSDLMAHFLFCLRVI
ncbi:hypothetical protein EG68_11353 [Paragonimus skrjabini miyazakii]|uniref:Uncharacterized protein n=1 Tax=Paragonimus skrjabini miyazakii TaxID=59628 RepID=A0A8S9YI49_9TREM|nr:hypothetical protein EG68_11353 [Paragonimus skrjabini miyazakii]